MSAVTWDGHWLAGPWLVREALDLAFERIANNPVMTIVIRRSAHIGCLAAYPRLATERNLMLLLSCSDPSVSIVAPHGAVESRFTPNPIAAGWPTDNDAGHSRCLSLDHDQRHGRAHGAHRRTHGRALADRSRRQRDRRSACRDDAKARRRDHAARRKRSRPQRLCARPSGRGADGGRLPASAAPTAPIIGAPPFSFR